MVMKTGEKIKKIISNLKGEDGCLYEHNFRINREHIIFDEKGTSLDLKQVVFGEFYANEMILHLRNSEDRFLLAYEGIEKLTMPS